MSLYHGTIIQTGITCKETPFYMCASTCRWYIVKKAKKWFEVMLNIFECSQTQEIVESCWSMQIRFHEMPTCLLM